MSFERQLVNEVESAVRTGPRLLQLIVGPRQAGKTTAAWNLYRRLGWPGVFESADWPQQVGAEWVETQWHRARKAGAGNVLLVLDEIQKVPGWSEVVKRLWDEEERCGNSNLRVLLLGSSALLLQRGMTESLAGRFFLHRCTHWSWPECREAFGWDLEQWLFFGGYPGAAKFWQQPVEWCRYVVDSLIETVLGRDVLQMQVVQKPALLRELFLAATRHPAQVLSYNKILGQLLDAGNTVTLAHYLNLLEMAFLLSGLPKFRWGEVGRRGSSPKLVFWNNALITAVHGRSFDEVRRDGAWWGRLVENAVGAQFLNSLPQPPYRIAYWREGDAEVDYVVTRGDCLWALEVKSGRPGKISGLAAFRRKFPQAKALLIGSGGIPLEEFFATSPEQWLQ